MKNTREGYEFPRDPKIQFRKRAAGSCQFPGEKCSRPNNGQVHHLTGVHEAKLNFMKEDRISDPKENALMLCDDHAIEHDLQEGRHIAMLLQEIAPEHEIYQREFAGLRRLSNADVLINAERQRVQEEIAAAIARIKREAEKEEKTKK